jgi:hypothetical protein
MVLRIGIIAKVMEGLYGCGETRDVDTAYSPSARETLGWVGTEAAILELLGRSARGVKRDGVEVDAAVGGVANHEPSWKLIVGYGKAEVFKSVPCQWCIRERDDAVEVVVFPSLDSYQGIHAPTPVKPDADAGSPQGGNHLEDVSHLHQRIDTSRPTLVGIRNLTWIISTFIFSIE